MKAFYRILSLVILCLGFTSIVWANNLYGGVHKLDSGFKLFVKQQVSSPITAVAFCVCSGSLTETDETSGYSELLSHVLFSESENFTEGQLSRELTKYGIKLNSIVTNDFTIYTLVGTNDSIEKMIELGFEGVFKFKPNDLFIAKKAGEQLIHIEDTLDEPENAASKLLLETAFTVHPYRNSILGSEYTMHNVNKQTLMKYYNQFYLPSNTLITVVGNVNEEYVEEIIKKKSYNLSRASVKIPDVKWEPTQIESRFAVSNSDKNYTYTCMGWPVPGAESSDKYALHVIAALLGGDKGSRLWDYLVDNKKVAYSVGAAYYDSYHPMLFQIGGFTAPGKSEKFVESVKRQIKMLSDGEFTIDEVDEVKCCIIAEDCYKQEDIEWQAMNYAMYAVYGNVQQADEFSKGIMNVTLEDIKRVAKGYFHDSRLNVARIEPFPASPDNLPEMITLENGVRVILKENHDTPVVAGSIKIAAGSSKESSNQSGVANFLAKLLDSTLAYPDGYSCSEKLKRIGVKYNITSSNNYISIDFLTMADKLPETMYVFAEMIKKPYIESDEYDAIREKIRYSIDNSNYDPITFAINKSISLVFTNADFARPVFGSRDSINKLSKKDLKEFHKKHYVGRNIVMALSGDFYSSENKDMIIDLFKLFPSSSSTDISTTKIGNLPEEPASYTFKLNRRQAVVVATTRCISNLDGRAPALEIIKNILCDRSDSRLKLRISDQKDIYSAFSEYKSIANEGCIVFGLICDPKAVEESQKVLREEIENLIGKGFTDREVEEAKKNVKLDYMFYLATNSGKASDLAENEVIGRGFAYGSKYINLVSSVTRDQINEVLQNYFFKKGQYVELVVAP